MTDNAAPSGCALCGEIRRTHGVIYDRNGSHAWQEPTQEQRKARMRARRAQAPTTPTDDRHTTEEN